MLGSDGLSLPKMLIAKWTILAQSTLTAIYKISVLIARIDVAYTGLSRLHNNDMISIHVH